MAAENLSEQHPSSKWLPYDVTDLPREITEVIFKYLSETDLCHVAMVCRAWREAANMDSLWRPLCRRRGWERYGTSDDITKETPYVPLPSSADQQVTDNSTLLESGANTSSNRRAQDSPDETQESSEESSSDENSWDEDNPKPLRVLDPSVYTDISFKEDSLIANDNATCLVGTCRWKAVFMKARHLENNWGKRRYNVVSYDIDGHVFGKCNFGDSDDFLKAEKDYLVACVSEQSCRILKIWNIRTGTRHQINVKQLDERPFYLAQNSLQIKNGIVVIGCKDGIIRAFSVSTGEELHVMKGHKATDVVNVFFDGETIVSRAKSDNDIRVWNVANGTCQHVLSSPSEDTKVKELDYRDNMVAASYSDNCIRLWDTKSGDCIHTLKKPPFIKKLPYDESSCKLGDSVVASYDEYNPGICIWSKNTGEFVANISGFAGFFACEWGLIVNRSFEEIDVYDETGSCLQEVEDFNFPIDDGVAMVYHRNRCVFEQCGHHQQNSRLFKMSNKGLKLMWRVDDKKDDRHIHVLWMDDTKIILSDDDKGYTKKRYEDRFLVCHFW